MLCSRVELDRAIATSDEFLSRSHADQPRLGLRDDTGVKRLCQLSEPRGRRNEPAKQVAVLRATVRGVRANSVPHAQ